MPRAALPLLCALLVAALGVAASLLWLTRHQPELTLLAGGPGEWIVYPLAPQARARDRVDLEASFRRAFRLAELPARAALEARAFGRATVRLNGAVVLRSQDFDANWKRAASADVTAYLRPGENVLEVRVLNDAGPPALNLAIVAEELLVATDAGWEASLAGAAWHPARPASRPTGARARPFDPAHASPATALRASPAPLAACALLSALAVAAGALFQRRLGGRPWPPRLEPALVAGAVALWLLLFFGNAGQLPLGVGFDVEAHLAYLDFLLDQQRLPLASDGWQMYQPPLFYLLAAGLLGAFGLATTDPGAAWVLRGLTFATGIAQVLLLYAGARLLWPARPGPRLLVLLFAAFLPLHLYLFQYVGNEGLAAALASAASLLLLRLLRAPRPPARGYAALGACLGAALLAKFSTLVLVPAALVALAVAANREAPGAWRPRLRGALLALGVALVLCGWQFVRVWLHFGDPFIGNWDPSLGYDWWQDPGYRTPGDFLRFGHVLASPWFASFHGLWDGLYSTLWGDGLLGGLPLASQSLWSQGPMAVGYWLALVPSLCIAVGAVLGLTRLLGRPRPAAVYLATLAVLMGLAFVALYLRVAAYGQAKAFYAQPALLALCAAFALGADWIARRGRAAALVLLWLLGLWGANAYLSVWVTRNPASLYARSQLLFATGAIAEAEAALDEGLRLAPENAQLRLARFELLHETGRHTEAEAALRRALEADPDATGPLLAKAGTQIVRREYTEAEARLRRVLAQAPADDRVHRMLASALIGQRRLDEAEAALREQLRFDPTDRLTQLTLVRVLSLSDREAAARQLRHWLRIAPDDAEARQLREELDPDAPRREADPPRSAARPPSPPTASSDRLGVGGTSQPPSETRWSAGLSSPGPWGNPVSYDLVIRNGTLVDGTGAAPRMADVAVRDGRIAAVGEIAGGATRSLDAEGLTVTPGFVDIHTHYDGQATWDPQLAPSCYHGVTTVVMGNCGVGFAPVRPGQEDFLIQLMEGVEDIPGAALHEGIRWGWESFPEYLDVLDSLHFSMDVGTQVPHGAVRTYVMGERGANNEPATPDDVSQMAALVKQGLAAGALGFSTSRTLAHRAITGEPVPGTFAEEDELFGIGQALGDLGRGIFEVAGAGAAGEDVAAPRQEFDWMRRLSSRIGRPVTFAMVQVNAAPDLWRELLELSAAGVGEGAQVYPQVAGRPFGMLIGHQTVIHPFAASATYDALSKLPLEERVRRMREPETKRRILAEALPEHSMLLQGLGRVFPMGDPPDYEPSYEDSIEAIAKRTSRDPVELLYERMLERDGKELFLVPILNYSQLCADPIREMLYHPRAALGLGDAGAHCGLICDASIQTFMLTHWVRDRKRGERVPVEFAVKRMTKDTADLYGLRDRGTVEVGMKADLNVIDLDGLRLAPPEMVFDLPAGGKRFMQRASGYRYTVVSGEVTLENDEPTGALPGRLIRGS